ncbi:MAG TPA: M28 family peptidase [Pyrinomonadaceae bacterium]|nr:M28 family peptidase [Pyrinomonadaceae bacterium]
MKLLLVLLAAVAVLGVQENKNPAPAPTRNGSLPWVSPDGSRIAFISERTGNDDVFVINADGSGELQLTNTADREGLAGWSPDSKRVVFAVFKNDATTLYEVDLDTKSQRQLAIIPGRSPVLSPDGKQVVYWSGDWTSMRVFVAPLDDLSKARQINDGASIAWMTRWSPDGEQIAFTGRNDPKSELAIFVVNADGSGRRQVTRIPAEEGGAQAPAWSRDGRQIAIQVASRTQKGLAHLWIVDVRTGEARKLNAHDARYLDETPSWFLDGKRLAFQSDRSGRMEVWVMNSDGTKAKQLTGTKSTGVSDPAVLRGYQRSITADGLASRLHFLASDFFEGRETTTRGQKLAAYYLASEYRQLGLTPRGTEKTADPLESYFQPFTVYRRTPKQTRLEVAINGERVAASTFSADAHDDLSFFSTGGLFNATGQVVFAGYGVASDYAALSAKGIMFANKWLLILENDTQFVNKRSALWKIGKPKGVLIVSDVTPRTSGKFADLAAQASLNMQRLGGLSLVESTDFPPTFAISTTLANQLLAPSKQTVESLKKQLDETQKPTVFELDKSVHVTATIETCAGLKTENVLAFIEGSDPKLKDEVVIISAHYDHLGINPALKGDQIYNGAADDGSGVVASLELAQWFMRAKRDGFGPRRSLLFINFSGEEKGLLGSRYYTQQPIVPWENTVADINMDGVGGFDAKHPSQSKNYIYILGTDELSTDLIDATKRLNQTTEVNLEITPNKGFGSDHQSFEAQLVPYIYYSTGLTEKYHQPEDEPDTIDYDHLARVVRLVFATAWEVANRDMRVPAVDRSLLTIEGYTCPPCPFACDDHVFEKGGECPVCGMGLVPKYVRANTPKATRPAA